jgi:hypothetical protein
MLAALGSGAARRALRRGSTAARLAKPGSLDPGAVLGAANHCVPRPPAAGPDITGVLGGVRPTEELPSEGVLDERFGRLDSPRLVDFAPHVDRLGGEEAVRAVGELVGLLEHDGENGDGCRPLDDFGPLVDAVSGLCDPHRPDTGALVRVHETVHGLPEPWLAPPDLSPELDLPLSVFLQEAAPDWLLPGIRDVPMDRALGAASNPVFIEAFLVGANQRSIGELRWRNIPIVTGWMPLRRFWNRIGRAGTPTEGPQTDVDGIVDLDRLRAATLPDGSLDPAADWLRWGAGTRLGAPEHRPDPTRGEDFVVVFRTTLFHRYPATIVTLVVARVGADGEPDWTVDPDFGSPVHPTFSGRIGIDLSYFGFPVDPQAGRRHWVVIEEPPPGPRFWSPGEGPAAAPWSGDGGAVAAAAVARPVRVLLGRLIEGPP